MAASSSTHTSVRTSERTSWRKVEEVLLKLSTSTPQYTVTQALVIDRSSLTFQALGNKEEWSQSNITCGIYTWDEHAAWLPNWYTSLTSKLKPTWSWHCWMQWKHLARVSVHPMILEPFEESIYDVWIAFFAGGYMAQTLSSVESRGMFIVISTISHKLWAK